MRVLSMWQVKQVRQIGTNTNGITKQHSLQAFEWKNCLISCVLIVHREVACRKNCVILAIVQHSTIQTKKKKYTSLYENIPGVLTPRGATTSPTPYKQVTLNPEGNATVTIRIETIPRSRKLLVIFLIAKTVWRFDVTKALDNNYYFPYDNLWAKKSYQ